jgi:hypothetical protein
MLKICKICKEEFSAKPNQKRCYSCLRARPLCACGCGKTVIVWESELLDIVNLEKKLTMELVC